MGDELDVSVGVLEWDGDDVWLGESVAEGVTVADAVCVRVLLWLREAVDDGVIVSLPEADELGVSDELAVWVTEGDAVLDGL